MSLLFTIAFKHLFARKRQSLVSLFGIILGVGFFLAISSLMRGSENDFMRRLVDNSPHLIVNDEFRNPRLQPVQKLYPHGAVELRSVKPITETRGIRNYEEIMRFLQRMDGLKASPVLTGQALVSSSGKDFAISLTGMQPEEIRRITTIENYLKEGSLNARLQTPMVLWWACLLPVAYPLNLAIISPYPLPQGKPVCLRYLPSFGQVVRITTTVKDSSASSVFKPLPIAPTAPMVF
jgi:hypothetical protein